MNKETSIQNAILVALSQNGILAYRQMVGKFRPVYSPNTIINIGITGQADIGAIIPVKITQEMVGRTIGMAAQIEVKTITGRQREGQKIWQEAVESKGGVYLLARSPEECIERITGLSSK